MAQERGSDLLTFWGCFENQHGWGPGAKFGTYFVCFNFHFQLSSCFIDRKFNPGFHGVSHPCPPCKIPKFKLCLSFGILHSARMFEGLWALLVCRAPSEPEALFCFPITLANLPVNPPAHSSHHFSLSPHSLKGAVSRIQAENLLYFQNQ